MHGITSVVQTTRGEGLLLRSPSELSRFSLSAQVTLMLKASERQSTRRSKRRRRKR